MAEQNCEREKNADFHTLMAMATKLRDQLDAFRELYAENDVASADTVKWFDNFKRRLDRRRK